MFAFCAGKIGVEKRGYDLTKIQLQGCKQKAMNYLKGIAGLNQDLRVDSDSLSFHYLVKHNNKGMFSFSFKKIYNSIRNNIR